MDSLAQRCSSNKWPIMIQRQRSVKNTVSAIMVEVSRNEVESLSVRMVSRTAILGIA